MDSEGEVKDSEQAITEATTVPLDASSLKSNSFPHYETTYLGQWTTSKLVTFNATLNMYFFQKNVNALSKDDKINHNTHREASIDINYE